jgi:hypothetical protein
MVNRHPVIRVLRNIAGFALVLLGVVGLVTPVLQGILLIVLDQAPIPCLVGNAFAYLPVDRPQAPPHQACNSAPAARPQGAQGRAASP